MKHIRCFEWQAKLARFRFFLDPRLHMLRPCSELSVPVPVSVDKGHFRIEPGERFRGEHIVSA